MAWLQRDPSQNYHIGFRFGGKKFKRSLHTTLESNAEARRLRLEENIRLVESGRLQIPPNADVPAFLLSDGKLNGKIRISETLTLTDLFDAYFSSLPADSREESTLEGMRVHRRHLERVLGKEFAVQKLTVDDIQQFVATRASEGVVATTINKPIVTFRTIWNWGVRTGRLKGRFPSAKEIEFPKEEEKPPFMTWEEIERRVANGEPEELWDCLYLRLEEVEELLDFVRSHARHEFVYPMVVMAAHTGVRRSELMRSEVDDFDGQSIIVRERKRVRRRKTTRRVPVSSRLAEAMEEWMAVHPGGRHTFCMGHISRSRVGKKKDICRAAPQPISRDEAHDHFQRTFKGSKWERLKGWHALRHSFISNLAARNVDQRLIDEFVGHTSEAMRRRYRHLFPETKQAVIRSIFK